MGRPTPTERLAILERRSKVAALWLAHVTQETIAQQLGVSQQTVSRDIAAVRASYLAAREELIDREAAGLDQMERECCAQYAATKDGAWLALRLKVKERRSRLLGLDAPAKVEAGGPDGGPMRIELVWVEDWRNDGRTWTEEVPAPLGLEP